MISKTLRISVVAIGFLIATVSQGAIVIAKSQSIYSQPFPDPQAIDLASSPQFSITSGTDITQTLQSAIDSVSEHGVFGVILIPSGNYILSDTVYVWKGIRLVGYGATRPLLILESETAGFDGTEVKYMLHFASNKPEQGQPFRDANPGTFYSALSNIDFKLGNGNASAVAVRSHWAQHCFISHVRFEIGSALAGIDEVGNIVHDCEFIGGQYGIMTKKPSPSWPFALLDSQFSGQSSAAILTEEGGLSVVRCQFSSTPLAIEVREGRSEELVMDACSFEAISEAVVCIGEPSNARTQVNLLNCEGSEAPIIATFRDKRPPISAPDSHAYHINHFSHGLHIIETNTLPTIETRLDAAPASSFAQIPQNPERSLSDNAEWVDVTTLGAVGDGKFDNTGILEKAIAEHEYLYFPTGRYRITDTISLKPHTCLIGLNPITTQILIHDETPAFHPAGSAKAIIESSRGGDNIVQGIGIDTGAINYRAVGLKWMASEQSVVNDVRLIGGHGTYDEAGNYLEIYNNNRSADSNVYRRWNAIPASLWVTDNGGGSFKNIWTPSPFADAGMLIEKTTTPGYTYQISSEHHLRHEFVLRDVSNWNFYATQFEEEMWEGRNTLPLQIERCENLRFHNTYVYRVNRTFTPSPYGIEISDSKDLQFYGIHTYGPSKFTVDDTVRILDTGTGIRSREIAWLNIEDSSTFQLKPDAHCYELLAGGFNHIDSPEIDSQGNLYFVDEAHQQIWCWNVSEKRLFLVFDAPIEPSQIILDGDETLLILSRTGKVYRKDLNTGNSYLGLELLEPQNTHPISGKRFAIPTTRWRDSHDFLTVTTEPKPLFYNAETVSIPSEESYANARIFSTWFTTLDLQRTYNLESAPVDSQVFVSDEFSQKTWKFHVGTNGSLESPELFAEEGECGVAIDPDTQEVYIAAGHIFVYDSGGTLLETLTPPHRPTAITISRDANGGKVLYILARTRLYKLILE